MENSLAKALPVTIGFMANLAGIGGIAKKIKDVIKKLRQPIDKAVEKVVGFVADKARALMGEKGKPATAAEKEAPEKAEKVSSGLAAIDQEEQKYLENNKISRDDAEKVAVAVKRAHPVFKSLTVVDGGDTWDYEYVASPGKIKEGPEKAEEEQKEDVLVKVKVRMVLNGKQYEDVNPKMRKPQIESGTQIPGLSAPNCNTKTMHAEIGAMYQALLDGNKGGVLSLEVMGLPVCRYCQNDIKKMAQKLELKELQVTDATGYYVFIGPNDFKKISEGGKSWGMARRQ